MIFKSQIMANLVRMVERVAPSNVPILILGETGTGKSLLVKQIYERSSRKDKPLITVNCGALRETLLESELFGHEKGSFTGAYSRKLGLIEIANGGTLCLQNVEALTPGLQAKVLRFLQEDEIYRLGGKDPIQVSARLITTTSRELDKEVMKGNFREDLYYRISTIMLHSPPLRRRLEDIEPLIKYFLKNECEISDLILVTLMRYSWPGNIRELENLCTRLKVLAQGGEVQLEDLPNHIVNPSDVVADVYDPAISLYELEKRYITKAMSYFEGNKTKAANALGITIKTLYNKLHEYGEFDKYSIGSTK